MSKPKFPPDFYGSAPASVPIGTLDRLIDIAQEERRPLTLRFLCLLLFPNRGWTKMGSLRTRVQVSCAWLVKQGVLVDRGRGRYEAAEGA